MSHVGKRAHYRHAARAQLIQAPKGTLARLAWRCFLFWRGYLTLNLFRGGTGGKFAIESLRPAES